MLTPREKYPLPKKFSPEEDRTHDAARGCKDIDVGNELSDFKVTLDDAGQEGVRMLKVKARFVCCYPICFMSRQHAACFSRPHLLRH